MSAACVPAYKMKLLQEHSRRAGTMTLKWRQKKQGWSRSSTSIHMPVQVLSCDL